MNIIAKHDGGRMCAWAVLEGTRVRWVLTKLREPPVEWMVEDALRNGGREDVQSLEEWYGAVPLSGSMRVVAPKGRKGERLRVQECGLLIRSSYRGRVVVKWPVDALGWRNAYLNCVAEVLDGLCRKAM